MNTTLASPFLAHPTFVYDDWTLTETQFNPEKILHRETVFTIGNGYLGTRGSFEEGFSKATPATFIHGVYDDVPIVYTELANCPDWLPLTISIDGDRFRLDEGEILSYERQLNVQYGILNRTVRWRSPSNKTIEIRFERFASFANEHLLVVRCHLTPLDSDSVIEVQASLNSYTENLGFNHWEWLDQGKVDHGVTLRVRTRNSRIELGMACKLNVLGCDASLQMTSAPGYPTLTTSFMGTTGQTVTVEKLVTVYTSRDGETPLQAAKQMLVNLPAYADLLRAHKKAWENAWDKSDIVIEGDRTAQLAVRYNLFQLLISAPTHDPKVSIAAKTLSGFGYRGHVFWDTEIFILPFFTFTQPELAKNLLTYRYHTLAGARRKAAHYGYKGAMYAWESALTGDEVTPRWSLPHDPYGEDVRIWCRDREIHISADVVYAIWYYWQSTADDEWVRDYGAEIILDTAVFWMSRVEWNTKQERYEIREVIGADEYHELVSNNAFTNRMVQWHLEKAVIIYDWLKQQYPERFQELQIKLKVTPDRRSRWQDIINHLWVPYDESTGLIEQFEGFFKLQDINLQDYEPRTKSMQAILGIEGVNKWQVLKQPDVLMLLYLMRPSPESRYSAEVVRQNWEYYTPRTDLTYGSSLGPAIQAILAAEVGKTEQAYEHFWQSSLVDLEDTRGNAGEGIHGASAGGVWQAVVYGFGGIQVQDDAPVAYPHFPPSWTRLKFKFHWRGQWHEFDLKPHQPVEHRVYPDIRGVIFDLDGVLTDTAEFHYRAWQRLADEEGLRFDRQANEALRGVSRRDSLMKIIGDRTYSEAQIQAMMDRKNRYYVESIDSISPVDLLPGATELLDELRQAGIKTAIGSASKNAIPVVEKLGIADKVDAIADGNSIQNSKPAPDLFLHAAELIDESPAHCVVVEDAASGIEAAHAAHMPAIGLGPVERVGAAQLVLPNLAGVTLAEIKLGLARSL